MKYLKKFENRDESIDPYFKKLYVKNNNYSDLYTEINILTDYKFDFELYYKIVNDEYIFIIIAFIKSKEYTNSKTLHYNGYQRYDTLKSEVNTTNVNIMKEYLNNIKNWSHINNINNIETEITANKFNI